MRSFVSSIRRTPGPRALLLLAGFLFTGCATQQDFDANPYFTAGIQQDDIPVPLYFQFDKDKGYSLNQYASGVGSFRSWVGYYYGDQQVGNLIPWYMKQMAVDGWAHKSTSRELGKERLIFAKGEETSTIWLYREYDPRFDRFQTIVRAEIHPTEIQTLAPEEAIAGRTMELQTPPAPMPAELSPSSGPAESAGPSVQKAASVAPPRGASGGASPGPVSSGVVPPGPRIDKPVVNEEPSVDNNGDSPAEEDTSSDRE